MYNQFEARISALEQRFKADDPDVHTQFDTRIRVLEQKLNDARNSFTTNLLTVNEIRVNRWRIMYESNVALVFRDLQGNGDKRYAMWNDRYVDL
ncbi:7171_t:CDS:2 [Dentiscutata erythropus]|uniref:7171_t:CDS:1 n=1 Tax=Dentiscutata erythropus TaxID=1348616 RepID=A0A9N8ZV38_9GLOM|nr:7171_t:CDS:2 [Dentiscutata erythropus]